MKYFSLVVLLFFSFTACGMQRPVQSAHLSKFPVGAIHELPLQPTTPPEYYSLARPASFSPASASQNSATESDNNFPESKSDKAGVIILSVLAGAALVAGIVIPLVILK